MIIRTAVTREYTSLPNALLRDKRLSLETKGLLAYLLSLPPSWEVRPRVVAAAVSPEEGRPLGMDRLRRMFNEAIRAGYMARSQNQTKREDGFFGAYVYIVGPDPEAVSAEVAAQSASVAFLPQPDLPCTGLPCTAEPAPYKRNKDKNYTQLQKEKSEFEFSGSAIAGSQQDTRQSKQKGSSLTSPSNRSEPREVVQNRIANRLGSSGWLILMALSDSELDQITAQERAGRLTDQHIANLRLRESSLSTSTPFASDWKARRDQSAAVYRKLAAADDAQRAMQRDREA